MLKGNEVHIYRINIPEHESSISNFRKILSANEIEKADRFKFPKDHYSYTICRAHLRNLLSDYLNKSPQSTNFSYTKFGKPYIEGSDIYFNLSHSGERCVIAVSHIPETGVDIEKIREVEDLMKISERYFSKTEFEFLNQLPDYIQTKEFFKIWTLKEAFIKAIGEGLSYPLKKFSVLSDLNNLPELNFTDNKYSGREWKLTHPESVDGYYISLAVRSDKINVIYK